MELTSPPRPGQQWMQAVESQLHAKRIIQMLRNAPQESARRLSAAWELDDLIISNARPFYWGAEPTEAVFAIADKIPMDTQLNSWNLETNAVWWHFEKPLPIQTTTEDHGSAPIQAFSAAWINHSIFACVCWTTDPLSTFLVCPSQVWCWHRGETLEEMMARIVAEHRRQYGPGGRFHNEVILGEDGFKDSALKISKFVVGALMWLTNKVPVLVAEDGHVERHRRKEFNRVMKPAENLDYVKVIQLRKQERRESGEPSGEHREYKFRFIVEGHVRNQPVGPGHKDRKLIWISPFIKGPDDKPLRVPSHKVYLVNR